MYEFFTNPDTRAVLFGAVLLVPILIWAVPESLKDLRKDPRSRRDRLSPLKLGGPAWK